MIGYSLVYLSEERLVVSETGKNFVEQTTGSADIVIKVPVAVPYQNDWEAPEPVTGQIEHEGQFYQMKSQQLINDTLYVQCAVDQNARDRFSELVSKINDQVTGQSADSQKGHHAQILKNFLKEYMSQDRKHTFFVLEWTAENHSFYPSFTSALPERHFKIPSPPPNLA
jgi:hypothetical protein